MTALNFFFGMERAGNGKRDTNQRVCRLYITSDCLAITILFIIFLNLRNEVIFKVFHEGPPS